MKATENTNKLDNLIDELEQSNVNKRQRNILLVLILIILTAFIAYLFYSENIQKTTNPNIDTPISHDFSSSSTANNINTPPHKNEGAGDAQKLGVLTDVALNTENPSKGIFGAQFPNGSKGVTQFLKENVIYPDDAFDNEIEGKVLAQITIDEKGNVTQPTIVQSLGYGCDEEVIRVLSKMPKWKPATRNNIPMKKSYVLTVSFSLD